MWKPRYSLTYLETSSGLGFNLDKLMVILIEILMKMIITMVMISMMIMMMEAMTDINDYLQAKMSADLKAGESGEKPVKKSSIKEKVENIKLVNFDV